MLDLLTRLVDKSLVLAEEREGETRYRMLEPIRQYARDHGLGIGKQLGGSRIAPYYGASSLSERKS